MSHVPLDPAPLTRVTLRGKVGEVPPDLIDMYVSLRVKLAVDLSSKAFLL